MIFPFLKGRKWFCCRINNTVKQQHAITFTQFHKQNILHLLVEAECQKKNTSKAKNKNKNCHSVLLLTVLSTCSTKQL